MIESINHNGNLINDKTNILSLSNRLFRYGDGVFESIRIADGKIINSESHFNRLVKSLEVLKIISPKYFNQEYFEKEILKLVKQNNHIVSARVRFSAFRADGGFYLPENNNLEFIIESICLDNKSFQLNKTGLNLGLYSEITKTQNLLSPLKTCNSLIYIMASLYAKENNFDDCLILNDKKQIIEATSSNVFIVYKNEIFTPDITDGCVDGTMRKLIIEIAKENKLNINYKPLLIQDLCKADEVFLTSAISGIKWVFKLNDKNYHSKTSDFLLKKLNAKCSL
ncbi:MAG: aminotransferase class IV [Bacteroidetes bacterium]|nr:aminotransferase class IV [Bacteroidota bacterium]